MALAALAFLALAAMFASTAIIRNSLLGRIDAQLETGPIDTPIAEALMRRGDFCNAPQVIDAVIVVANQRGDIVRSCGQEKMPSLDLASLNLKVNETGRPFNASAGSKDFRMIARRLSEGGFVAFGLSLADTNRTIGRILFVQIGAVLLILVGLVLLARWLLRRGLAPLAEIALTADAITAGNRSRRVDIAAHPNDEAGRVGTALNSMLDELDRNFDAMSAAHDQTAKAELRVRQFVQDASHELKTPLTSITGYTELYRSGALPDDASVRDAIGRIDAESHRMTRLVNDMLRLAKLDTAPALVMAPHDVVEIARVAAQDSMVVDPGHPVRVESPAPSVSAMMDDQAIRQVFANILANTRQHTPPGTMTTIEVHRESASVRIVVANDGPGFDPDVLPELFERFVRADPSRRRTQSGAGLGLSIVRSIVTAHDGTITAANRAPRGAMFVITLPI